MVKKYSIQFIVVFFSYTFRKKRQIPNYAGEEYDDGNTYYDDNLGLIFDNAEIGKKYALKKIGPVHTVIFNFTKKKIIIS